MIPEAAQIEQLATALQSSMVGGALLIVLVTAIGAILAIRFVGQMLRSFERSASDDIRTANVMRDMLSDEMAARREAEHRWLQAFERSNELSDSRNATQQRQTKLLEEQNTMHKQQLEQLVVIGKNQTSWHAVIDTDLNNFREHMLMLSTRVNALEDVIDRLAQLMTTEPDSDKAELILTLLQTIATNLDNLNTRFDRMSRIEVTSDGGDDETAAQDAAA